MKLRSSFFYLLGFFLTFAGLTSSALAQEINPFQNNLYAFFADPVMFSGLVVWLGGILTEQVTDWAKDRNVKLRGWHTRVLAAMTAAVVAGGGGFFGLSHFTDLDGPRGAGTAAGLAFLTWLKADISHRASQLRKTGKRQAARNGPPLELPRNLEGLFELVKNSELPLELRQKAVNALKAGNPVVGLATEALLAQVGTRPLTPEEGKAERDSEIERREAAADV